MRSDHFVSPRRVASWSGSSCRMPRPRPILYDWMLPVTQSTGALAPYAVHRAALALSTPGPGTQVNAPTRPVDFA